MTELQQFIAMLERAGIGHGTRDDFNPAGTGVQVEHEDDEESVAEYWFDDAGLLKQTYVCEPE